MNKILFPTDFSESANNALAYAAKFASDNEAELVLYNANKILQPLSLDTSHEKLNDVAREVRNSYNISCSTVLEPAAISWSNLVGAEAREYDLIIMGTNGADDLIQFFTGSNAFNVILKSNVPLLIIPLEYTDTKVSNAVYAFDYYKEQKLPVKQLLPWLKANNNNAITVLQVIRESSRSLIAKDLMRIQRELGYTEALIELKFDSVFSSADLALSINQYMIKTNSTALCLCTQKRNFFEGLFHKSVIKHITAIASYPLYVFHQ
jgi:nucleotide-binding universal stress UspA family protein